MASYRDWPAPVRAMAEGIEASVAAARAGDADGFAETMAGLARVDAASLAVVLGELTRELLERAFPDGLDSDDAGQLVDRCAAAATWYPGFRADALVQALTGALGVSLPEEVVAEPDTVAHGLLLIAELAGPHPLAAVLGNALRELRRQQTVEMP
jgi:hypothetical protein